MKERMLNVLQLIIILNIVIISIMSSDSLSSNHINNDLNKSSGISDTVLLDNKPSYIDEGVKKVNIYIDNNTISFDKSNTTTELDYNTINTINMSDKSKWNIITNNLVEEYDYNDGSILIKDNNVKALSFSFISEDEEYNYSIINDINGYKLVKSNIKLIHGNMNSLWYTYFYDLKTAIKAARSNDIIVLYDDIDVDNTLTINKSLTIMSNNNINTINSNKGFLFNLSGSNISLTINNVLLNTNSFIKGKSEKNKIIFDNSKVLYKNKVYSSNDLKGIIKSTDNNIFIKASL